MKSWSMSPDEEAQINGNSGKWYSAFCKDCLSAGRDCTTGTGAADAWNSRVDMRKGTMTKVTKIPFPNLILAGDWSGIVYAITTEFDKQEEHNSAVEQEIKELKYDFNVKNHYTVSLREVKREILYSGVQFCTLVEFRVRDSY